MNYPGIETLKSFFCRNMLRGWVGDDNAKPEPIEGLPGYKGYEFEERIEGFYLKLIDAWCSGVDSYSSGFTTIYMRSPIVDGGFTWIPIWTMHYMGHYDEEAIPIVKAALRHAYEAGEFHGGRGRHGFVHRNMQYRNARELGANDEFIFFRGHEAVTGCRLYMNFHRYFGMTLFRPTNT